MRAFSRGELAVLLIYSRSHCFVSMPIDAETRLSTRLENQRMLIRTERGSGLKGGGEGEGVVAEAELADSCAEICLRRAADVSSGSSCKSLYDSILKAVKTAENRPA